MIVTGGLFGRAGLRSEYGSKRSIESIRFDSSTVSPMPPPGARPRATLAAVAREAGVSVSTASLAFSGNGPVAAGTRDRVLAAATALGYPGPDPRAQSLRRGTSGVIGVVIEDTVLSAFRDPVNVGMVDGIAEVLGESGAGLLLLTDALPTRPVFDAAAMDGVLLSGCSPEVGVLLDSLRRRGIPTVLVGSRPRRGVIAVDVDNTGSTLLLARHLHGIGHRRVATVTLSLDAAQTQDVTPELLARSTADTAADRLRGVWEVFPGAEALAAGSSSVVEGERLGRILLDRPDAQRPTAIVAQSDLLAYGVLQAAETLGIAVPDRLSVVGFDGIDPIGPHRRALTTMRQPMQDKGRTAAVAVLALIAGRRARSVTVPCEFVPGATTAPPP